MSKKVSAFGPALDSHEPTTDQDWEIRLGFLLHDCARLRRTKIDETFKPLNVTRSQAWLLAYLSRCDGATQSALAEQMNLGKVAVGGLIDRLEASGMIERRASPTDRRVNEIYLTEQGSDVVREIRKLTLNANKEMLKGFTVKEIKTLVQLLDKFRKNL
jgi:DNA-binding MarR family transcriptional regulator